MKEELYPDMESICRLCLKEDAGSVEIFPKSSIPEKACKISIPMRIMACAALEVQVTDDLPKLMCAQCRYQLEKSYYFRKRCQASDGKLRKHLRLMSLGKVSRVFAKADEEYDDEMEFEDSLNFIRAEEEKLAAAEQRKYDEWKSEQAMENEKTLQGLKEELRESLKQELREEVEANVRKELRAEMSAEIESSLRRELRAECAKQAKEELRVEVEEECRQKELQSLLAELQTFLQERCGRQAVRPQRRRESLPENCSPPRKVVKRQDSCSTLRKMQITNVEQYTSPKASSDNGEMLDTATTYSGPPDEEASTADDEAESDANFYILQTEEAELIQEATESIAEQHESHSMAQQEDSSALFSGEEGDEYAENAFHTNENSSEEITSYQIEDNGEIHFFKENKRTVDLAVHCNEKDDEELSEENIMVLNFEEQQDAGGEEHLDMVEFGVLDEKLLKINTKPNVKLRSGKLAKCTQNRESTATSTSPSPSSATATRSSQRVSGTPKIFKCDDCPMTFSTANSLERHLRNHRKVEEKGVAYQCPKCQIFVSCSSALRRHMFVHSDKRPFSCEECGKSFVQREILKRHMQTHTGVRPHKCRHCERSFSQRVNLTEHVNRNHMETPRVQQHCCHFCPKRFNHASGLSRHLATHNGVAFQCSECDRTFGDRSSVKRHIVNMHGTGNIDKSTIPAKKELAKSTT